MSCNSGRQCGIESAGNSEIYCKMTEEILLEPAIVTRGDIEGLPFPMDISRHSGTSGIEIISVDGDDFRLLCVK